MRSSADGRVGDNVGASHAVVVRYGRVGDMVLLSPLLSRLHARFGAPSHLIGAAPWSAALYEAHPDVARVTQVERHRPLLLGADGWRLLRRLRADRRCAVYVAEVEPRALAKVRRVLALAGVAPSRCVFLADDASNGDEHWVDRLLRFGERTPAAFADVAKDKTARFAPSLAVTPADRIDRERWLHVREWSAKKLVLLQPANKRTMRRFGIRDVADDDKSWPIERWAALARAIAASDTDIQIVLCGAPNEAEYLQSIREAAAGVAIGIAANDLPLRRLLAVLEVAHGMVSVDTGPAHMSAAMGCPLVVLFGRNSPRQWLPRSPSGSAVVRLGGPPFGARVDAIATADVIKAWSIASARA